MKFQNLPGFPKLFVDFAEARREAAEFFPRLPGIENLVSCAAAARSRSVSHPALCELLLEQAHEFGCSAPTLANIEKLASQSTIAVLARVRPGMLGGRLSSWLAMLTAAHLASFLERQSIQAVPVCWVDPSIRKADLRTGLISRPGAVWVALDLNLNGAAVIPDSVHSLFQETAHSLEVSANDSDVLKALEDAYAPRISLSVAFCRAVARLLAAFGFVLIDPSEPGFEKKTRHLLPSIEAAGASDLVSAVVERLKAAGYELPNREEPLSGSSIEAAAFAEIQSSLLLPAAATVVSEDQVFDAACAQAVMGADRLTAPLAWPRISATVLDARCRKTACRYGVLPEEVYKGPAALSELLAQRLGIQETLGRTSALEMNVREQLTRIESLLPADEKLAGRFKDSCGRMLYQAGKLRGRVSDAGARRHEAIARQIGRLCSVVAPWESRQETELAGFQFLLRHSDSFPGMLYNHVDPFKFEHQIISVD